MKRLHVHTRVSDLAESVRFYTTLFSAAPDVIKPDYAKWMLDDPRVNFAISADAADPGIDHLGIQVDDDEQLAEITARLEKAGSAIAEQQSAACCYASADKTWVNDPQGVAWETFHTTGEITVYGTDRAPRQACRAEATADHGK